jgi:hypothetical protein
VRLGKIGRRDGPNAQPAAADELAERRIAAARACRGWQELDADDLVQRDRGFLVHADSDEAFRVYRGDAFSPSGAVVADMTPLAFYVDADGVHVLERCPDTWSELTYQRERAAR